MLRGSALEQCVSVHRPGLLRACALPALESDSLCSSAGTSLLRRFFLGAREGIRRCTHLWKAPWELRRKRKAMAQAKNG